AAALANPAAVWSSLAKRSDRTLVVKRRSTSPPFCMITTRRLFALLLLAATAIASAISIVRAADDPESLTLEKLFRPGGATHIAISPDGRHVAYTVSGVDSLKLAIVDLEEKNSRIVVDIGKSDYARDG